MDIGWSTAITGPVSAVGADSFAYGDTASVTYRLTDWSPPAQREKTNLEWLDERVNEMRVKL